MAHRVFTITMAADNNYHQLYTMLLAQTGAVPTDGILPDRCSEVNVSADQSNAGTAVFVSDSNFANSIGKPLYGGDSWSKSLGKNVVCLREIYLKGNGLLIQVEMSFI